MNYNFDGGHLPFAIGAILYGLFVLALVAVALVVAFLLARFLLVATKAAKIYVEKNGGTSHAPVAASTTPVTTVAPVVAPEKKPRTPKAPPVV
jgi:hypothetical protein